MNTTVWHTPNALTQFFTSVVDYTFSLLCSFPRALSLSFSLFLGGFWSFPASRPQLNRLCLYSKLLPNKRHGTISPKLSARTWTCGANRQRLVHFDYILLFTWFIELIYFIHFVWCLSPSLLTVEILISIDRMFASGCKMIYLNKWSQKLRAHSLLQ